MLHNLKEKARTRSNSIATSKYITDEIECDAYTQMYDFLKKSKDNIIKSISIFPHEETVVYTLSEVIDGLIPKINKSVKHSKASGSSRKDKEDKKEKKESKVKGNKKS